MRAKSWMISSMLASAAIPALGADLLRDDFDAASLNTASTWNIGTWGLGRTQLGFIPQLSGGAARLRHDTYNPSNPGGSFKGSEIYSKDLYTRGAGIEFETSVRTNAMPSGLVTSFFTYIAQAGSPPLADEIDFEFLTKAINASPPTSDPVLATTWNNYRTDGSNFGDPNVHSSTNHNIAGLNLAQYNTFKIRWLPDRVQWYVNNVPIRMALYAVPDLPTPIRANFWAPNSDWGDAYNAGFAPTANPALNTTHLYDIDYIAVRRIFNPVAGSAPNRVFTDTFRNGSVSNSDSNSGFWTQQNLGTSTVTESSATANLAEPLKLTASGAGFPHAQIVSPVRSEFNLFREPVAIEATGLGFASTSNSTTVNTIGKSILRFVLSPQTLTSGSQSEYTTPDALALRIEGGNLVALGSKVNTPNANTEYNSNLVNQVMSGPVRRVYLVAHGSFYLLQIEHDLSNTDSTQTMTEFSGALNLNLADWNASGDSAMFIQGQLNNSGAAENMTAQVESLAVSAVRPAWSADVSGVWSNVNNWTQRPVPNYPGAHPRFTNVIGMPRTVTADIPVTAGTLTFDSPVAYTVGGSGTITLNTLIDAPKIEVLAGSHTIAAPLHLAKSATLDVASGSTLTLSEAVTAAASAGVTKVGAGAVLLNNMRAKSLNIAQGAMKVAPNGGAAGASYLDSLTISPGASLDLTNNDLVVNNGSYSDIRGLVLSGFGAPAGITSSTSDGSQILALFDNALVGAGDWLGQPIATNAIVGKYTYFGDANIDGQVTGDDYTVIDANLNTTPVAGLAWLSGDMNLDGIVTGDDYTVLDANLGLGAGSPLAPGSLNSVPEPTSLVVTAIGGLLSLRRRRER